MANPRLTLSLFLFASGLLSAQEVKFIDLRNVQQRTVLRYPPSPEPDCEAGQPCVVSGSAGGLILDGAPDRRDPHALGVYLLRIVPNEIDPPKPFEAEFRILNTGLAPIELPISPHLSDLQPINESATFTYWSLALVIRLEGPQQGTPSVGYIQLYGAADQGKTMLTLEPGQWIQVQTKVKLENWPKVDATRATGEFWLRRNTFHPHPGGWTTTIENVYPNVTPTPRIDVR